MLKKRAHDILRGDGARESLPHASGQCVDAALRARGWRRTGVVTAPVTGIPIHVYTRDGYPHHTIQVTPGGYWFELQGKRFVTAGHGIEDLASRTSRQGGRPLQLLPRNSAVTHVPPQGAAPSGARVTASASYAPRLASGRKE